MSNTPASRRRLIGSSAALLLLAPFAAGTAKTAEGIRAKAGAVRTAIVGTYGDAAPQVSVMIFRGHISLRLFRMHLGRRCGCLRTG